MQRPAGPLVTGTWMVSADSQTLDAGECRRDTGRLSTGRSGINRVAAQTEEGGHG